jgi:hypothetical protein
MNTTSSEQWVVAVHYRRYRDQHYGTWATAEEATAWATGPAVDAGYEISTGNLDNDPEVASWKVTTFKDALADAGQDSLDIRFPW